MQRVPSLDPAKAQGRSHELLASVEKAFGLVPNAAKLMANSPAVLDSFLSLGTAMSAAKIGERLHAQIRLAASEANACTYCTSILSSAIAPSVGLTAADIMEARSASATDRRSDAALKFAVAVLERRGKVGDDDLRAVRAAGFDDAEIVEIVASVVAGCFTNFLNNVARTTLDFPEAAPLAACSA